MILFTDSIEKKFNKQKHDVEDTVFKAIDQLKDSLRKKYPKLPADRKNRKGISLLEPLLAEVEKEEKEEAKVTN